ncbi:hypothetical protein HDU67_002392 [Dinochytrium kinnereticum]|nr:hypothetical protein HDU67_002392 [Dinochytrium kinnereticum]
MEAAQRPLNAKEASYLLLPSEFTNFGFSLAVSTEPFQSFAGFLSAVKDSLKEVSESHPILRSRIVSLPSGRLTGNKLHLEESASPWPPIPVRVETNRSRSLHAVLEDEMNLPIPITSVPLMRVVVVAPSEKEKTTGIVFTFPHSAMDGRCGMEVVKDWARAMRSRTSAWTGQDVTGSLSSPRQSLEDVAVAVKNLVPSSAKTWTSLWRFISHLVRMLVWIRFSKPAVLKTRFDPASPPSESNMKSLQRSTKTRGLRISFTKAQTSAAVARAKTLGVSLTALLMASTAVAVAPFSTRTPKGRTLTKTSKGWWSWLPFSWLVASSSNTAAKPPPSPSTPRRPKTRTIPLLAGLAIDARPALGIPSSLNGAFNTGILVKHTVTPYLPVSTSHLGLFNAAGSGAASVASSISEAIAKNVGYAWRYAALLPSTPHPNGDALLLASTPHERISLPTQRPSVPMAYTLTNIGRVELQEAEDGGMIEAWVKEAWMMSTVKPVSSWGIVEVNAATVGGVLRVILGYVDECFDEKVVKEVAKRIGVAMCGVEVNVA